MLADVLAHYGLEGYRESGEERVNAICHEDRHKSASVNWDEEVYFCHTCSWGGDAIAIVSRMESLTYRDAYRMVEELAGRKVTHKQEGGLPWERKRTKRRKYLPSWRK